MTNQSLALPDGHLLLTPEAITGDFLVYLERMGIPDPADDLEFIVITDADRLTLVNDDQGHGAPAWELPWEDPLRSIVGVWRAPLMAWHKVEFADGLKAVGICSH